MIRTPQTNKFLISKRKIITQINDNKDRSTRWPNNTIIYKFNQIPGSKISKHKYLKIMKNFVKSNDEISRLIDERIRVRIMKAFKHWELHTCIKFELYNPLRHLNYLTYAIISKRDRLVLVIGVIYNPVKSEKISVTMSHLGKLSIYG